MLSIYGDRHANLFARAGPAPLWYKGPVSTISLQSAPSAISEWLALARQVIDEELSRRLALPDLPPGDPVYRLAEAMRYAVLGEGKRLRPALVLAACQACGGNDAQALPAAAAVEILHAYTLVHDDLPAMDDDDERRGRPTVHVKYDHATAILAGDALLTQSFACLAELANGAAAAVAVLAQRAGRDELLGGQMLDLMWQDARHTPTVDELERLHRGKTGALFAAACQLGAIAAGRDTETARCLARYGMQVGVAFQHADDLDDGDFPEAAQEASLRRVQLATAAQGELEALGQSADLLRSFAQWIGHA